MRPSNSQVALLGIRVDDVCLEEAVSMIDSMIDSGGCHRVGMVSPGFLSKSVDDEELRKVLNSCDLVIADGKSVVWAARLMGGRFKHGAEGARLLQRLLEVSVGKKRRIFLMGATEHGSRRALEYMQREYPEAEVCGCAAAPMEPFDAIASGAIVKRIEEAKPEILIAAFGNPEQEKWFAMHHHCHRVPVCIGAGASADILRGRQSHARGWMRFRMGRMAGPFDQQRRIEYLDCARLLLRVLSVRLFTRSIRTAGAAAMRVSTTRKGGALIVRVAGDFTGPAVCELRKSLEPELASGCSLVMDLSSSSTLRPDGAEFLAGLTHGMMDSGAQLWLAGIQPEVRKVLRTSFPEGHSLLIAGTVHDALRALRARREDHSTSRPASCAIPAEDWMVASDEGRETSPKGRSTLQGQLPNRPEPREATAVD
jgi:N-acetylglucosaminyldiphosphoundecaprenol N-acetyl-beta-D-mannosaminyltransferase